MKLRIVTLSLSLFLFSFMVQAQNRTVTLLTPSNGQTLVPALTQFNWDTVETQVDSFELQVSKTANFSDTLHQTILSGSDTIYTLSFALEADSTYFWRVISFDSAMFFVETSNVFSFTIGPAPGQPTNVSPTTASIDVSVFPTLTWMGVPDADEYHIQVSTFNNFSDTFFYGVVAAPTVSVNVNVKLKSYTVYYWRVAAKNIFGYGEWSNFWNFTTLYTGLNLPMANFGLMAFPNPARQTLMVNFDGSGSHSRIAVLDAQGKEVQLVIDEPFSSGPQAIEIPRNGLPAGLYFIKLEQNGMAQTVKVIFE